MWGGSPSTQQSAPSLVGAPSPTPSTTLGPAGQVARGKVVVIGPERAPHGIMTLMTLQLEGPQPLAACMSPHEALPAQQPLLAGDTRIFWNNLELKSQTVQSSNTPAHWSLSFLRGHICHS